MTESRLATIGPDKGLASVTLGFSLHVYFEGIAFYTTI